MEIFSCYSIKGGVGKTALAVNLAYFLRETGRRTLLVDLDPQGAAGFCFRVAPAGQFSPGSKKKLEGKWALRNVRESDFPGLDILPSNLNYRHLDVLLSGMKKPRRQLDKALGRLEDGYDALVLDCPPNITLLAENIFRASSVVLVPVIPTPLSVRTFQQLTGFLQAEGLEGIKVRPFFSMVQKNKRLHRETMEEMRQAAVGFLNAEIPFAAEVEAMGTRRAPLLAGKGSSAAARAYRALCMEVVAGLTPKGVFTNFEG
ncbi:MAG TPA: AAA family ATPase [Chthoniobacteraceae bacterium]|nr:AAA family ATPase [Chthoniobacteraceae bacterium]